MNLRDDYDAGELSGNLDEDDVLNIPMSDEDDNYLLHRQRKGYGHENTDSESEEEDGEFDFTVQVEYSDEENDLTGDSFAFFDRSGDFDEDLWPQEGGQHRKSRRGARRDKFVNQKSCWIDSDF